MIDKIFCTVPWFEVHINADGTYHSCGAQPNRISGTPEAKKYNVHSMTIDEWVVGQHQEIARHNKLNGVSEPLCGMCYHEESIGSVSKRVRENLRSDIQPLRFYETFDKDYFQNLKPTINSYHISLGNECNLACRICGPTASSKIAVAEIKAGTYNGPARMNWTEDEAAWNHVVSTICNTPNLKFVHLIGGETLLNPKFENLIDQLLKANKTDIYLGFTTNGTIFNQSLMEKLNAFRHVDVGISIECMGTLNDLIRQGSNTQLVLDNIDLYLKHRKEGHVYVTVRPVPSALSVHTLDDLYKWCISRKLDVMTNILTRPDYLQISQLPTDIKENLIEQYNKWVHSDPAPINSNPRDPTWFKQHIDNEIKSIITALLQPNNPTLTEKLYQKLSLWGWLDQPDIAKYFKTNFKA
jgi:sulfatase maturation enzyme AslB (radical SAM superfamily)